MEIQETTGILKMINGTWIAYNDGDLVL